MLWRRYSKPDGLRKLQILWSQPLIFNSRNLLIETDFRMDDHCSRTSRYNHWVAAMRAIEWKAYRDRMWDEAHVVVDSPFHKKTLRGGCESGSVFKCLPMKICFSIAQSKQIRNTSFSEFPKVLWSWTKDNNTTGLLLRIMYIQLNRCRKVLA